MIFYDFVFIRFGAKLKKYMYRDDREAAECQRNDDRLTCHVSCQGILTFRVVRNRKSNKINLKAGHKSARNKNTHIERHNQFVSS